MATAFSRAQNGGTPASRLDFCGNHAASWFARMRGRSRVFQLRTRHHWRVRVLRRSCPALRGAHGCLANKVWP
ncbi:hypothetical protein AMELA_G00277190 [Ameiurus melas]|uniref:Uncharacterized protein n=1 Tax=Ameiurus melas TaxID=219545 RepID=A0A7J5ZJB5_AMEME|nr:hypothetical protein AMELA_G00277190 [Ameiurus melas]